MSINNSFLLAEVDADPAVAGVILLGCIIAFCWFISWLRRPRLTGIKGEIKIRPEYSRRR